MKSLQNSHAWAKGFAGKQIMLKNCYNLLLIFTHWTIEGWNIHCHKCHSKLSKNETNFVCIASCPESLSLQRSLSQVWGNWIIISILMSPKCSPKELHLPKMKAVPHIGQKYLTWLNLKADRQTEELTITIIFPTIP